MKRLGLLASVFVLATGLLVAAAPGAWAGNGHGSDGPGFGFFGGVRVVHQGQSIQAAIDAVKPGGTIFVQHGTYAEHLVITKRVPSWHSAPRSRRPRVTVRRVRVRIPIRTTTASASRGRALPTPTAT